MTEWKCDVDDVDSLPDRLARISDQRTPSEFLEQARYQNRCIAKRVGAVVAGSDFLSDTAHLDLKPRVGR